MRRVVTWLVLSAYVALAAGLPLPAGAVVESGRRAAAAKDRSRPFPCMDSPCGCISAEQCFRECCCHSVAERLAWARRHGLEADVLAALESRSRPTGRGSAATAPGSCCTPSTAGDETDRCAAAAGMPSCCGSKPVEESRPVREAICTPGGEAHVTIREDGRGLPVVEPPQDGALPMIVAVETPPRDAPPERDRPRSVSLRALLACQGLVAQWVSVGGTLPPARVEAGVLPVPCGVVELVDRVAVSPPRVPEAPPPEAA